jgi:flagellar motor switch protein FliG
MPSAYSEQRKDRNGGNVRADIGGLMAELASRPQINEGRRKLSGPERAAVLMLALGDQYGGKIFSLLDDDELREVSIVMSTLGTIEADAVEQLLLEFVSRMSASGALLGNYDATERLLQQYLPKERNNTYLRNALAASWKKFAAPLAATCGKSSPTCRKRCWRTT